MVQAAEGWDPVTGLGTPDFKKLKEIVLTTRSGGLNSETQNKRGGILLS